MSHDILSEVYVTLQRDGVRVTIDAHGTWQTEAEKIAAAMILEHLTEKHPLLAIEAVPDFLSHHIARRTRLRNELVEIARDGG